MERITPEQITFRCFDLGRDLVAYHACASELVSQRLSRPSLTVAELDDLVRNFILTHEWFRVICIPGCMSAGFIYISPDSVHDSQLTFAVHPLLQGRGIATAAVTKAVREWFAQRPLQQWVDAMVYDVDLVAMRLLENVGFDIVEVRPVSEAMNGLHPNVAARDIFRFRYTR